MWSHNSSPSSNFHALKVLKPNSSGRKSKPLIKRFLPQSSLLALQIISLHYCNVHTYAIILGQITPCSDIRYPLLSDFRMFNKHINKQQRKSRLHKIESGFIYATIKTAYGSIQTQFLHKYSPSTIYNLIYFRRCTCFSLSHSVSFSVHERTIMVDFFAFSRILLSPSKFSLPY